MTAGFGAVNSVTGREHHYSTGFEERIRCEIVPGMSINRYENKIKCEDEDSAGYVK